MKFKTRIALGLSATALVLGAAACGDDAMEEFNDAPRGATNDTPADIVTFPDGFGNVAAKCDGPNMVYSSRVTGEGRSITVVPNDPRCDRGDL